MDALHLYLLERKDGASYDETAGCVVAAASEAQARELAGEDASGDEGPGTWLDADRTSCVLLADEYKPGDGAGLVLRDFRAG